MKRVSVSCLAWLILIACAGSDDPSPGKYASLCNGSKPCESGLVCAGMSAGGDGVCTRPCVVQPGNPDCAQFGPASSCDSTMHCYDTCTPADQCPPGLECTLFGVQQGTCRPMR